MSEDELAKIAAKLEELKQEVRIGKETDKLIEAFESRNVAQVRHLAESGLPRVREAAAAFLDVMLQRANDKVWPPKP